MPKFLKRETRIVYIMLGNSCNMSCTYCLQHPLINEQLINEINFDIYDFLCETAYENKEHRLELRFYGGEPLLYFNNIRTIVETLNNRNGVKFSYSIITNGKAMTDEIVKFFNDNNVSVALSWDGDSVLETRGFDVFADQTHKMRILKINRLCLTGVISAKAYPKQLIEAFQRVSDEYYVIHGYNLNVNLDEIFDTGLPDKELLDIDYKRVSSEIIEIMKTVDLYIGNLKGNNYYDAKDSVKLFYINSLIRKLGGFPDSQSKWQGHTVFCGNGLSVINMDLQGNIYPCHNVSEEAGNIYENFYNLLNKILATDNTKLFRNKCLNCKIFSFCRGGCKLIKADVRESGYCLLKRAVAVPVFDYINKVEQSLEYEKKEISTYEGNRK